MDMEWQKNATTWAGILLHPLGELSIYDYVIGKNEEHAISREDSQARMIGFHIQIMAHTLLAGVFVHNLITTLKTLKRKLNNISHWCCLFISLLGAGFGVNILVFALSNSACRKATWCIIIELGLITVANGVIMLHKAYLALLKKKWVAIIGMLFVLLQLGFTIIGIIHTPITVQPYSGCVADYPDFIPYAWIGAVLPVNLFFSGIFSYVTYKQYQLYGLEAWRRLAQDGIQTMCLVVLCNIIFGVLIVRKTAGGASQMFFLIDMFITSTILIRYCASLSHTVTSFAKSSNKSNRPQQSTRMELNATVTSYHGDIHGVTAYSMLM